ncbi:transcriptional regulator, AlpA family [Actinacidiphila alni]|uniref:Transcriptional regulator, AlpA family n=1 Tax=Actinacidiphila alni TaxID=380248 RepID=A0A1I1Z9B0_9ACTN|nr:transcriptional regulator, AlpA family [Actinacidiphila alni]
MPHNSPPARRGSRAPGRPRPPARHPSLKLLEVLDEIGMSRSAFYRMRARGKAPKCIKLPNGQIRVRQSDLDSWLEGHEESTF